MVLLLQLITAAASLQLCYGQISVHVDKDVRVLPDDNHQLNSFAFLICNIEPSNAAVSSRWLLPNGDTIGNTDPQTKRAVATQLEISTIDEGTTFGTVILIRNISHRDAGTYHCEVRNSNTESECKWSAVSSIELVLQVTLQSVENTVIAYDTDAEVELACEMAGFIRSDEDLQWFTGNHIMISNGSYRHAVTYRNGHPNASQNGGDSLIPSRVSILTISDPREADTGTYTCRLRGTDQFTSIQLIVSRNPESSAGTAAQSLLTSHTPTPSLLPMSAATESSGAVVSVLLTATVIHLRWKLCISKRKKSKIDNIKHMYGSAVLIAR